jgi:hypothetical protein
MAVLNNGGRGACGLTLLGITREAFTHITEEKGVMKKRTDRRICVKRKEKQF